MQLNIETKHIFPPRPPADEIIDKIESIQKPIPPRIIIKGDLKFTAYLFLHFHIRMIIGKYIIDNIIIKIQAVNIEYGFGLLDGGLFGSGFVLFNSVLEQF